jgi:hypothetical protein
MIDPLDPRLASLLRVERARPDPDASKKTRVFAKIQSTLGGPAIQTSTETPRVNAGGLGSIARATLFSLALVGAGAALLASRRALRATVSAAPRGADVATSVRLAPVVAANPAPAPDDLPVAPATQPHAGPLPGASSGASGLGVERLLLDRARRSLLHGDASAALASVVEHERRFPRGALSEERDALRVEALVAATRYDEARASAAAFHAAHPGSLLTPAVDSALTEIP